MKYPVIAVYVLLCAGTLAGGLVQRRSSFGITPQQLLDQAAHQLARPLPERFGEWRLLQETELEERVADMLRCPAYVNRVYVHDRTGDRVSVIVLVGPSGPIAVHTPEICYSSRDFKIISERVPVSLDANQQPDQTFWEVGFESNDLSAAKMRVLYAWSDGSRWNASQQPRWEYGSLPYLYKIQIAGPESEPGSEFDPCHDFLAQFINQLDQHLVVAPAAKPWPL
ncbi:MAG TPA: exosortase-associated EpsI family protein [Pirellulaceae bacterium]|nr:exosortase-associated EpsI family protein [Pirellulaceae bacterium]